MQCGCDRAHAAADFPRGDRLPCARLIPHEHGAFAMARGKSDHNVVESSQLQHARSTLTNAASGRKITSSGWCRTLQAERFRVPAHGGNAECDVIVERNAEFGGSLRSE